MPLLLTALTSLLAIVLLGGCGTPRTLAFRVDHRAILHRYHTQDYDRCMEEIDRALAEKISAPDRAWLLLHKAVCAEESGRAMEARFLYEQVAKEFALTRHGDTAQRRLAGTDGDQREHLELVLTDPVWRRAMKLWNDKQVARLFLPLGETPNRFTVRLSLGSSDRTENLNSLDDAAARAEAEFQLRGGTTQRHLIEQTGNEAYYESSVTSPDYTGPAVSLSRAILTEKRFHFAEFTVRKPALTPEEKERYLALLRQATLVGNP